MKNKTIVAASRFWGTRQEEYARLDSLVVDLLTCVDLVIILVRTDLDKTDSWNHLRKNYASLLGNKLVLLCCTRDYSLSQGLNYILTTASNWILENNQRDNLPLLLMVSVEIRPSKFLKYLATVMDENTLCAGCAIPNEHADLTSIGLEWLEGGLLSQDVGAIESVCSVELCAFTCPWNTCCLWNIRKLQLTGFLMTADWLKPPGMEEVAVISVQQKLFGIAQRQVKLVYLPYSFAPVRHMQGYSVTRMRCHEEKMRSKQQRTLELLESLNNFKAMVVIDVSQRK